MSDDNSESILLLLLKRRVTKQLAYSSQAPFFSDLVYKMAVP
jgi:hypothetical protein